MSAQDGAQFPPVPSWRPDFRVSNATVLDRMVYYTNDTRDMVQFSFGTTVLIPDGLDDEEARRFALDALSGIVNYHPDFSTSPMDDGNITISYRYPAYNVVIPEFLEPYMDTIRQRHLEALADEEVLVTPMGTNVFSDPDMMALYGRTFMFMDATDPVVETIYRHQ